MVGEYDGTGKLVRRYVFGPGVDEPLVQYEGAVTTSKSWLYANQQGSVVALANGSGATTSSQSYGPFGEITGTPVSRFGYTGQQYLVQLGLYYYKARMYSPTLGRFLQTDPIGYKDDLNWYAYVGNNPVNLTDPTGASAVTEAVKALIRQLEPGANAGKSIPATGARVTAAQSKAVTEIGKETGCHLCGATDPGTKTGNFVGDHMPPTSIAKGQAQSLYPSCLACSNTQGGILSGIAKVSAAAAAAVSTAAGFAVDVGRSVVNGFIDDPVGSIFWFATSNSLGDGTVKHRASGF